MLFSDRYEHRALRFAFDAKDDEAITQIATRFSKEYPVWAWKLPAIQREFELVANRVSNPHFVMIFKEPLSVAARKTDLLGSDTLKSVRQVLTEYQQMADVALATPHPLLLISYDRAMANLRAFIPEAARFAGINFYVLGSVIAGIREDGQRYFGQSDAGQAAPLPSEGLK